jgi:Fe-S-cluster containining protein
MNDLLDNYGALLREVDVWFQRCFDQHSDLIACRKGCSECCRGLFDITLLDALYLKRGFDALPEPQQSGIAQSALLRLEQLSLLNPVFVEPWLLNAIPEDDWDALMPEEDANPCLLLSEAGGCLVDQYRPMTCRLNGIPLIDVSGEEMFDDWCTMNFIKEDPRRFADLRFEFTELFSRELLLFQKLIHHLTGTIRSEVDLFIPAAVVLDCNKIVEAIKRLDR